MDLRYVLCFRGRYIVKMYKSSVWWMIWPCMWIARQLGLDQSHILVCVARWLATSTVIPPEWERASWALLRMDE